MKMMKKMKDIKEVKQPVKKNEFSLKGFFNILRGKEPIDSKKKEEPQKNRYSK